MRPERWRREAHCIADLRRMAKRVLPRPIFDFADGGAQDERTLRRNEQAFDGITLLPRPLNGAAERDSQPRAFRPSDFHAGHYWPHGPCRPILADGRASCRTGRSLGGYSKRFLRVTRRPGCRSSYIEIAA